VNRKLYYSLIGILWLAMPVTALRFWLAWDRLPLRMATHFNAAWQPNGWMPRQTALAFALGIMAFVLMVFSAVLVAMERQQASPVVAWTFLGFAYAVASFIFVLNSKVVSYNLGEGGIQMPVTLVLMALAPLVFTGVYLYASRREALPSDGLLAQETHTSGLLGGLLMAPAIFMLAWTLVFPASLRVFLLLTDVILLVSGLAAWSGFHYAFSSHGLEIRTLGFRLRSIPAAQIRHYAIEPWNFWRGYGIRGVGKDRAYVWGNRGVRINTAQGDVYLGHDEPERVVRDLNMITGQREAPQR